MLTREMKDSGIEWVGDIPADWKIDKIRNIFTLNKGLTITKSDLIEKGIPVISYGEIHSKYGFRFDLKKHPVMNVDEKYLESNKDAILNQGDFIFADTSEDIEGSGNFTCYVSDEKCFAGYHTVVMKPRNEINYNYYAYLFDSLAFRSQIQSRVQGIKVFSITQRILKPLQLILPSEKEQGKIVEYLDEKTKKINDILRDTKQSIEELKKYKQSIITEAVTKGLDPDEEMKESSIEWASRIPNNWNEVRLKSLFQIIDNRNLDNENAQLLSLYTSIGVKPRSEMVERGNKAQTVINYKYVKKGDLVVNKLLAWMGAIGYSDYDGVTSPDYDVYRARENIAVERRYYNYYFRYTEFKSDCYKVGRGIMLMRWRTYPEQFLNIIVPHPSLEEQTKIADYLDDKVTSIDKIIEEKGKIINELEKYKKSLIYEYVTGKKEV